MRRGPRNLQISADGIGLTQFGGVVLIDHFFQHLGLRGALARHVRFVQRNNRYSKPSAHPPMALAVRNYMSLSFARTARNCVEVYFQPFFTQDSD